MQLNYKKYGDSGENLIIVHGLLGSGDNWVTLSKRFANDHIVWAIDQRNHGRSEHSAIFNYEVMADDLMEFIETHQIQQPTLMGHSMGGKTIMQFLNKYPDICVKFISVDMAPKIYDGHHDIIFKAMKAVNPEQLSSRNEADEILSKYITSFPIRQFLLKNLTRNDDMQMYWRMNLDVIYQNYPEILKAIYLEKPFDGDTLFVRGTKSNYILNEDFPLIQRQYPNAEIIDMDAGHWVHSEVPDELYEAVNEFLER